MLRDVMEHLTNWQGKFSRCSNAAIWWVFFFFFFLIFNIFYFKKFDCYNGGRGIWTMDIFVRNIRRCYLSNKVLGSAAIWSMIPHCLMWGIWRGCNAQTFEGCENSAHGLKFLFLKTLFEWINALCLFSFATFSNMLDCCNFHV